MSTAADRIAQLFLMALSSEHDAEALAALAKLKAALADAGLDRPPLIRCP